MWLGARSTCGDYRRSYLVVDGPKQEDPQPSTFPLALRLWRSIANWVSILFARLGYVSSSGRLPKCGCQLLRQWCIVVTHCRCDARDISPKDCCWCCDKEKRGDPGRWVRYSPLDVDPLPENTPDGCMRAFWSILGAAASSNQSPESMPPPALSMPQYLLSPCPWLLGPVSCREARGHDPLFYIASRYCDAREGQSLS